MEVRPGYKQTEVGVIPEDWDVKPLGDIGDCLIGLTYSPNNVRDHGTLVLRSSNIQGGSLTFDDNVYVDAVIPERIVVQDGDILICVRNGSRRLIGKCALLDNRVAGQTFGAFMSVFRTPDSAFVFHQFQSDLIKRQIDENIGATINQITNANLNAFKIPLPSDPQERLTIAAALSDVDALLATLDQLIAKKRDLKQAAMQQLLTGQTRLPWFSGEWEVKRVRQFADCTSGGTPSTSMPTYWGGSIRWMSSGELNLKIVDEVEGRITEEGLRNSSTKMVPTKCVLIGLAGQGKTRGTVAMNMVELCTNQSIAAILPSPAFVSEYLYYNLDARYDELRGLSTGDGGRGGLNLTIIRSLSVPFPEIPEQTAIAAVLSDMDAELSALVGRRDKTRALKQGMMQELLTGKTRLVPTGVAHA